MLSGRTGPAARRAEALASARRDLGIAVEQGTSG
jgi:hypothetical protein